ncbi:hypothetical protein AAHC03_021086 [Spirometra sp. Aus1]
MKLQLCLLLLLTAIILDSQDQRHYLFRVTKPPEASTILGAELHLYRLPRSHKRPNGQKAPRSARQQRSDLILLKLYLAESSPKKGQVVMRMLDARWLSSSTYGWIVFNLKSALEYWLRNPDTGNLGFILMTYRPDGSVIQDPEAVNIAQRRVLPDRFQPSLVVYYKNAETARAGSTEKGPSKLATDFVNQSPTRHVRMYAREYYLEQPSKKILREERKSDRSSPGRRFRRAAPRRKLFKRSQRPQPAYCRLQSMIVKFADIGWNKWIISPSQYDAGLCAGKCRFPLGQEFFPTNHAVVQSIWHQVHRPDTPVPRPCCVPHELEALPMLYFESENNVVLRRYENMIVKSCGCNSRLFGDCCNPVRLFGFEVKVAKQVTWSAKKLCSE